jgi:murein DD-endopeptidase MepM/ murein hydrolase activator NlpD
MRSAPSLSGGLRTIIFLPWIVLALAVAGCSTTNGPSAPADYREGVHGSAAGGSYTVQRGDTIYGIARQLNVPVRALIDANNLQPPFQMSVGQVLVLPGAGVYVVAKDDTLLGVARKTGVSFSTLVRINNLSAPYVLRVGQKLKLPAGPDEGAVAVASPPPADSLRPVAVAAPVALPPPGAAAPPPTDKGAGGYSSLAERESKTASTAIPPPPPPPPPPGAASSASAQGGGAPAPQAASAPASQAASAPAAASAAPAAPAAAEQHAAATPAPLPPAPPSSGRGFVWPVRGQLLSEFGTTGKGQHNDGINIAVARGTPVVASQDGVVAYSGNELRGFGNLLLIKHADGWMTAYAHNDTLLVKRGDTVRRGQQIAKAGDSGGVAQPQLHFEVRQGTRAVDPMGFLGGKTSPASSSIDSPDPG